MVSSVPSLSPKGREVSPTRIDPAMQEQPGVAGRLAALQTTALDRVNACGEGDGTGAQAASSDGRTTTVTTQTGQTVKIVHK